MGISLLVRLPLHCTRTLLSYSIKAIVNVTGLLLMMMIFCVFCRRQNIFFSAENWDNSPNLFNAHSRQLFKSCEIFASLLNRRKATGTQSPLPFAPHYPLLIVHSSTEQKKNLTQINEHTHTDTHGENEWWRKEKLPPPPPTLSNGWQHLVETTEKDSRKKSNC